MYKRQAQTEGNAEHVRHSNGCTDAKFAYVRAKTPNEPHYSMMLVMRMMLVVMTMRMTARMLMMSMLLMTVVMAVLDEN